MGSGTRPTQKQFKKKYIYILLFRKICPGFRVVRGHHSCSDVRFYIGSKEDGTDRYRISLKLRTTNVFLFLTLCNDEQSINWDKWFYSPGMPAFKPKFDESLAVICQELADRWTSWKPDTGNV